MIYVKDYTLSKEKSGDDTFWQVTTHHYKKWGITRDLYGKSGL